MTISQQRKWPTVIVVKGETKDCALSCNAFTFRYVQTSIRLHITFPFNIFIFHCEISFAKLGEDSHFSGNSTN